MIRVLFVCTGNICRSPTAEGVFRTRIDRQGLSTQIGTDSAGTENYHIGDSPDIRTISAAKCRGYVLDNLRARQICQSDFLEFDLILALDRGHYQKLIRLCPPNLQNKIKMCMDFSCAFPRHDVPDPYYGGASGFETVLDMVEDGALGLLNYIRETLLH